MYQTVKAEGKNGLLGWFGATGLAKLAADRKAFARQSRHFVFLAPTTELEIEDVHDFLDCTSFRNLVNHKKSQI